MYGEKSLRLQVLAFDVIGCTSAPCRRSCDVMKLCHNMLACGCMLHQYKYTLDCDFADTSHYAVEILSLFPNIYSQVASVLGYQQAVAHVTHLHDSNKCKLAHFLIELLLQACGQLCSSSAFRPLCRCWSAPYNTATTLMMPAGLIAAHSAMLSQHRSLEQSRHSDAVVTVEHFDFT